MQKVKISRKEKIVNIISEAFKDNKSIRFVIGEKGNFNKKLKYLIEYSFYEGLDFGDVFLNKGNTAAAIIIDPLKKKTTLKSIIRDIGLIINVIGFQNIFKVLNREKKIKAYHPKNERYVHLWYIGVENSKTGKGIGSSFLDRIKSHYKGKHILLETSTVRNFNFYERNGFEKKGIIPLKGYDLHIYST
ncbi:GNAT family N-acetyltransferase [Tenacibaculum sp. C7A-26P2]|uniref:GNAT family N-acetyltransferase n=1 Tax=Tenacibaculum sp. C7A-26P2 TaxID=3447504 RepID=UPI003F8598EC